jgi:hypothetical protein
MGVSAAGEQRQQGAYPMKTPISFAVLLFVPLALWSGSISARLQDQTHFSFLDLTQQGIEIGYLCQKKKWTVEQCKADFVAYMQAKHGPDGTR